MRVPPPIVLAGALALAAAIAAADPTARPRPALRALGAALALGGVALALAGVAAFRRRRTTVDPLRPERASALVADGVYRRTRNPMYLGLVAVAVGWAAALGSAPALVAPALLALYLDRVQIRAEERALRARFGAAFDAYARRRRPVVRARPGGPERRVTRGAGRARRRFLPPAPPVGQGAP
jgi:protein-S-isoprenylcysteine O-methyltransferase Ste14